MPAAAFQRVPRLRQTAARSPTGDWDFDAILNREVYPAIRALIGTVLAPVEIFNLSGATHTLAPTHVFNYLRISHSSACTLTIPADSTGFVSGDWFRGIQAGAGALTIVAGAGVTINFPETLVMYKRWGTFTLINVGSSTWDFDGDVELA